MCKLISKKLLPVVIQYVVIIVVYDCVLGVDCVLIVDWLIVDVCLLMFDILELWCSWCEVLRCQEINFVLYSVYIYFTLVTYLIYSQFDAISHSSGPISELFLSCRFWKYYYGLNFASFCELFSTASFEVMHLTVCAILHIVGVRYV